MRRPASGPPFALLSVGPVIVGVVIVELASVALVIVPPLIDGVVIVGDVPRTLAPLPVLVVTPVPPLATGRVPVMPVANGRPIALVRSTLIGVPKAGATSARPLMALVVVPSVSAVLPSVIAVAKLVSNDDRLTVPPVAVDAKV